MMGTMEWLWCLGVLHLMQFFHTLMPFRLHHHCGEGEEVWRGGNGGDVDDNDYIVIAHPYCCHRQRGGEGMGEDGDGDNVDDNDIVVFGTISVASLRGMAMCNGEGEEGWAWAREMLRRRAYRRGRGRGKGESEGIDEGKARTRGVKGEGEGDGVGEGEARRLAGGRFVL